MSESEIIDTAGKYRVRLVHDENPEAPYDDGGSPILRLDLDYRASNHWRAEQITGSTSHEMAGEIKDALERWGSYTDKFERYLRMVHGTTDLVWYSARGGEQYVTFDTADWREEVGLTDEYVTAQRAAGIEMKLADMSDYVAYLEGEVYGYVVEERVTWDARDRDEVRETWETVDSCWGFYGREYAEQSAREALAEQ